MSSKLASPNLGRSILAVLAGFVAVVVLSIGTDVALRAARPRYCALSNEKLRSVGIEMPAWQDALARYIQLEVRT